MPRAKDWADRAAERFYLTHVKLCQGPNAGPEAITKWLRALAAMFRNLKRGKK